MYYLNSRYYNHEWGRFINANGMISTGQGLLGHNMHAYCNNNPVNLKDDTGEFSRLAIIVLCVVAIATIYCCTTPAITTTDTAIHYHPLKYIKRGHVFVGRDSNLCFIK